MTEAFLGEIILLATSFPPRGWAFCAGQLLPINQNQALFVLLGTTYGGDGRVTFALPDLRGRVPISSGQKPGGSPYALGATGGVESVTLTIDQTPLHLHLPRCSTFAGTSTSPTGAVWAASKISDRNDRVGGTNTPLNAAAIGPAGGSQPHENRQPLLALNYCIALQGVFPALT